MLLARPPPGRRLSLSVHAVAGSEAAALAEVKQLLLAPGLLRAVCGSRPPRAPPAPHRAELRPVVLKDGPRLCVETFVGTQCLTRNVLVEDGPELAALCSPGAFDSYRVETSELTLVLQRNRRGELAATRTGPVRIPPPGAAAAAHDRAKPPPLLPPSSPLLIALGLCGADGVPRPSKVKKLAEVEAFLKQLDGSLNDALVARRLQPPIAERPLRVVDLGCGNAYLTFAAYELLAIRRRLHVEFVGVDSKQQAADRNTALVRQLGWPAASLCFVQGDIATAALPFPTPRPEDAASAAPSADIVLALHACDTATDDALARAAAARSPLVLCAPCCHHALQAQLREAGAARLPFPALGRHGLLRERLGDVLTDALRAQVLSLLGYRVGVQEFVSAEHTNRNLMLRCDLTGAKQGVEGWAELDELCSAWGVQPPLALRLEAQLRAAREAAAAGPGMVTAT